jgi:hypothetical protein
MTTITQTPGSDTLKVFFRMFYDDFLRDYKQFDPEFGHETKSGTVDVPDDLINKYFNDKVHIFINHKLLQGKLTASFHDHFEISFTLFYKSDIDPQNFRIRNQVLTRLYSDQANMIYLEINNYHDAIRLTVDHDMEKSRVK